MGLTGTGKSTFISLFTGEHVETSDNLESCLLLPRPLILRPCVDREARYK